MGGGVAGITTWLARTRRDWREAAWWRFVEQLAGLVALVGRSARALVTRPFNWADELVAQSYFLIRRVAVPLALSVSFFIFGAGTILTLTVLEKIGGEDRYGFGALTVGLREFNGWVTGMCVAGIAGTAICSDLGARKVREELDATAVLGIDPYRLLVLPRLLAVTLATPLLYLWATLFSFVVAGLSGAVVAGYPLAAYLESAENFVNLDLFAGLLKMTIIGFVIGAVSCFKGMSASGGPAGVGRAVNQAVVISFAVTWIFNYFFNSIFLAAFPDAGNLR